MKLIWFKAAKLYEGEKKTTWKYINFRKKQTKIKFGSEKFVFVIVQLKMDNINNLIKKSADDWTGKNLNLKDTGKIYFWLIEWVFQVKN